MKRRHLYWSLWHGEAAWWAHQDSVGAGQPTACRRLAAVLSQYAADARSHGVSNRCVLSFYCKKQRCMDQSSEVQAYQDNRAGESRRQEQEHQAQQRKRQLVGHQPLRGALSYAEHRQRREAKDWQKGVHAWRAEGHGKRRTAGRSVQQQQRYRQRRRPRWRDGMRQRWRQQR